MKTSGGFLISQVKQLQGRIFEKLLKENDIDAFNGAQGRILYVLWQQGQMNISEISKRTSLAKTSLTSMLDRMESSGLIQRVPDMENRRQITIVLTPEARKLSESYERISEEMNQIFYGGFSKAEIEGFEAALQHIIKNLEKNTTAWTSSIFRPIPHPVGHSSF